MSATADAPAIARGGRRRRTGRVVAGGAAIVAAGALAWTLWPANEPKAPATNDAVALATATVQRRDLVDHQDVDGTLGYAGARTVAAPAAGTITRLGAEGATVRRGRSLLSIDAQATAWVLYGTRPLYRDLGPGATDGSDVRQVERNLVALGYDPGTVDADWTSATTTAVEAFQEDRDLDETGTLKRTEVVTSAGPVRIGSHRAEVGDTVRDGLPVTGITSMTPVVTAKVDAGDAGSVRPGDAVDVMLPDGRSVRGVVTKIGTVAAAGQDGEAATVALRVALRDRGSRRLDGAPVTVSLETNRTKNVLAVPITALVATAPSTYAVELAGSHRLVEVELGASVDGWAEVSGRGLADGLRVVVPR